MQKRSCPNKRILNFNGFSLLEILVVMALIIIVILSVIPSFRGLSDEQVLEQNSITFESDLRLARTKAISGILSPNPDPDKQKNIYWGVEVNCTTGNSYRLGYYTIADTLFTTMEEKELSGNTVFDCSLPTHKIYYFERLTGRLLIPGPTGPIYPGLRQMHLCKNPASCVISEEVTINVYDVAKIERL